ncbi:MAG: hypothetical protein KGJ85_11415, partial [Betaproteobacteria bacterium]|nr:hypothetical protein [Betaproteobacteria bacterium]
LAGTEVLVAFRDGDPDQPLITAAVPNSENPSLARHDNAFIHQLRTAGGNVLLLDDRDGRQALRMHSPSSNSSLSLGSSSPDSDSAGVHIATEGDFINVVAGMRSDFQAGGSNSATLGATGNLSAGARSSIELGPVLHWSAGWALGWSAGTDATHSNQGWALQTPRAELGADQELALRAGLRPEARDALRALRVDCGTAALTGAASSLALSTVLFETLHTGPVQGAAAPGARGGAAAAGCLAFGVAARALIGSYSQRAEKLLQDAQASECVLQREQLQLRHQPGWAALERGLRMDAGGTTLEASVQRGAPDKANAWRQGPLQTRAVAGDAALDIDAAMALLKVSIAQAGKLELREAGLGVARGPRCRLGIHASGRVVLCATLLSIRPENELDLG